MQIINSITFNNDHTEQIGPKDIMVFVGPNNAGKSQALKDIYALCENPSRACVVVKRLELTIPEKSEMTDIAEHSCIK